MAFPAIIPAAALLLIGVAIGRAASDKEAEDESANTSSEAGLTEAKLSKHLRKEGLRIITEHEKMVTSETDLGDHIHLIYRGLYYLGRTEARLSGSAAESTALLLRHLHHQHRPRRDRKLISWYETVGQSNENSLTELLGDCPLVDGFDARYIAHAMGESVEGLTFDGIVDEMVAEYKI